MRNLLIFLAFMLSVSAQNIYLGRLSTGDVARFKQADIERIGRSPFYIIRSQSMPVAGKNMVPNSRMKLSGWHTSRIGVTTAQAISGGDGVRVGIIDSGTDFDNPALIQSLWVNSAEDLNGNGVIDSLDLNGIDDDGNGYIDDVNGYDFVDTDINGESPDFQRPDPFPQDQSIGGFGGHGTAVHDVAINIANQSKYVIVRAADPNGYLETDDVARALIYAAENGVQVLNLSFGGSEYNPFLEDVINYISDLGVMCIAASGNSFAEVDYPAGFNAVMAIGATDENDRQAVFSSYGWQLDMVAPGQNIEAAQFGGGQRRVSGTSFASPMVAAGAAMLKALYPHWSNEQIRSRLRFTAFDLNDSGYDTGTGSGRLDLAKALSDDGENSLQIHSPDDRGYTGNSDVPIVVSAFGTDIAMQTIHIYRGSTTLFTDTVRQQFRYRDTVTVLRNRVHNERFIVKLTATNGFGKSETVSREVHVLLKAPEFEYISLTPILGPNSSRLAIDAETSFDSRSQLSIFDETGRLLHTSIRTASAHMEIVDRPPGSSLTVRMTDLAGNTQDTLLTLPTQPAIASERLSVEPVKSGSVLLSPHVTDLNTNGIDEIWFWSLDNSEGIDTVSIVEPTVDGSVLLKKMALSVMLRDAEGDTLLFSYNNVSRIYRVDAAFNFTELGNHSSGLASRFLRIGGQIYVLNRQPETQEILSLPDMTVQRTLTYPTDVRYFGIPAAAIKQNRVWLNTSFGQLIEHRFAANLADTTRILQGRFQETVHAIAADERYVYLVNKRPAGLNTSDDNYDQEIWQLQRRRTSDFSPVDSIRFVAGKSLLKNAFVYPDNGRIHVQAGGHYYWLDSTLTPLASASGIQEFAGALTDDELWVVSENGLGRIRFNTPPELNIQTRLRFPKTDSANLHIAFTNLDSILVKRQDAAGNYQPVLTLTNPEDVVLTNTRSDSLRILLTLYRDRLIQQQLLSTAVLEPQWRSIQASGSMLDIHTDTDIPDSVFFRLNLSNNQLSSLTRPAPGRVLLFYEYEISQTIDFAEFTDVVGRLYPDTSVTITPSGPELDPLRIETFTLGNGVVNVILNKSVSTVSVDATAVAIRVQSVNDRTVILRYSGALPYGERVRVSLTAGTETVVFGISDTQTTTETIVFPNPYRPARHGALTFTNLQRFETLSVYRFDGRCIFSRQFVSDMDVFKLDFKREIGKLPGNGIYFYTVVSDSRQLRGKFLVNNGD